MVDNLVGDLQIRVHKMGSRSIRGVGDGVQAKTISWLHSKILRGKYVEERRSKLRPNLVTNLQIAEQEWQGLTPI